MDNKDIGKVLFSREQYEYLNKIFPELVGNASTTEAAYRIASGQRNVVIAVKERVR